MSQLVKVTYSTFALHLPHQRAQYTTKTHLVDRADDISPQTWQTRCKKRFAVDLETVSGNGKTEPADANTVVTCKACQKVKK